MYPFINIIGVAMPTAVSTEGRDNILVALEGAPYYPYYLLEGTRDGWVLVDGGPSVESMKLSRDQRGAELGWHDQPELAATSSLTHIIVDSLGDAFE